jgi:hypothetical protein
MLVSFILLKKNSYLRLHLTSTITSLNFAHSFWRYSFRAIGCNNNNNKSPLFIIIIIVKLQFSHTNMITKWYNTLFYMFRRPTAIFTKTQNIQNLVNMTYFVFLLFLYLFVGYKLCIFCNLPLNSSIHAVWVKSISHTRMLPPFPYTILTVFPYNSF